VPGLKLDSNIRLYQYTVLPVSSNSHTRSFLADLLVHDSPLYSHQPARFPHLETLLAVACCVLLGREAGATRHIFPCKEANLGPGLVSRGMPLVPNRIRGKRTGQFPRPHSVLGIHTPLPGAVSARGMAAHAAVGREGWCQPSADTYLRSSRQD
jgi:hypothetical protein